MSSTPSYLAQPLVSGERLSRAEFERRYEAMPDVRAELIEGVVHMNSPTRASHSAAHLALATWLGTYAARTPGVLAHDNLSYRLDDRSELQPDLLLMLSPACGGRARVDAEGFLVGVPELIIEVAAASAEYDLGAKFRLYQRAEVPEYLVWDAEAKQAHWWVLDKGSYRPLMPDRARIWRSQVFPGLWLDEPALARQDLAAVLACLDEGTRSPEHIAFKAGMP
ncbi:MAG: Uma2 family endonuclease [Anaerolineae bacterium]|nr:Uma2 family endonuclease [Thermoflexales bacterium]MDW8396769.1 Uma2 family endonuclease [Anaerolineae bacterium]